MSNTFDFDERLKLSRQHEDVIHEILIEHLAGAVAVHTAHESNDRQGTDYWVELCCGHLLSVDVKIRTRDYLATDGQDDVVLESWSVVEQKILGWTRDDSKRTDYVLYFWQDTGRWSLFPFAMLCHVFELNWQHWKETYGADYPSTQNCGGGEYHTECIFVPTDEVWSAIYRTYHGAQLEAATKEREKLKVA